ncbi:hypothetical protein D3C71_1701970 [compost metagenome]
MVEPPNPRLMTTGICSKSCASWAQKRMLELPTNNTPSCWGKRSLSAAENASMLACHREYPAGNAVCAGALMEAASSPDTANRRARALRRAAGVRWGWSMDAKKGIKDREPHCVQVHRLAHNFYN